MNRFASLLALSLLVVAPCFGQFEQKIVEAKAGELVVLEAPAPAAWVPYPFDASFQVVEFPDGTKAIVAAGLTAGTRSVTAQMDAGESGRPRIIGFTIKVEGPPAPQPPGPPKPPPPDPNGPVLTGVAKAAHDFAAAFPPESLAVAKPISAIYSRASQKLRDRSETDLAKLMKEIQAEIVATYPTLAVKAQWAGLNGVVAPLWDAMYAADPTLDDVADFLSQLSTGLEAVR